MIYLRGGGDPFTLALDQLERANRSAKQRCSPAGFPVDVTETDNSYIVFCDLPGLSKEDIKIDLEQRTLGIAIEKKKTQQQDADNKSEANREQQTESGDAEAKRADDHAEEKPQEQQQQQQVQQQQKREEARKATHFLLRERAVPHGTRKLEFEGEVDFEHVSASFVNGVLRVDVPKKQPVVHHVSIA